MKKGFSLLEVLVAVSILAFSLVALVNFQGQTTVRVVAAEQMTQATLLAREKMAEVILQIEKEWVEQRVFPEDKSETGQFEEPFDRYNWNYEIRKVAIPMPSGEEGSPAATVFRVIADQIKEDVREIKLVISWEDRKKERKLDVVTHITKI